MTKVNIKNFCKRMEGTKAEYINTILFDEENECAVATNAQVILVSRPDYKKRDKANHTAWFLKKETPAMRFGKLRKSEQAEYDLRNRGLNGMSFFPNYRCIFPNIKDPIIWLTPEVAQKVLDYMEAHVIPGEEECQYLIINENFRVKKNILKLMAQMPDGGWTIGKNTGMIEFKNKDYHAAFMANVSYDNLSDDYNFNIKDII